jgi:hypothetical protein
VLIVREGEFGRYLDTSLDSSGNRAEAGMNLVDSFGGFASIFRYSQTILDTDSLDNQNLLIQLDLALHLRGQIVLMQLDSARLQRASQGTGESPASSSDNVVEGSSGRRKEIGAYSVVLRDLGVNPEHRWLRFSGEIGATDRSTDPFNTNLGGVDDF